jgi:F-type H+-transporting ATPase subunit gamma
MANIREISGRIRSVQDTQKITNAMYMISSTKMRKARKEMEENNPYFESLQIMVDHIMRTLPDLDHPFLDVRPQKKGKERVHAIITITADKGLAGAYNHNAARLAEEFIEKTDETVLLYVVGEEGRQYFASRGVQMAGQFQYTAQNPSLHRARVITEKLLGDFDAGVVDEVSVLYTVLDRNMRSEPRMMQLLPLTRTVVEQHLSKDRMAETAELDFHPSPEAVLTNIIPDVVVGYLYSALVDSFCSEQNDRMMAMDAANRNADSMLHDLSIQYNRQRQAMITQEITEVIAGAKAQQKKREQKEAKRK